MLVNKEEELQRVTTVKTIMMFCVLLYHTLLALQKNGSELYQTTLRQGLSYIVMWLNSFHIQTFTFASGYLFYMVRYEKHGYRNGKKDIVKRWMRLLFPFYIVSILWAIPAEIFIQGGSWTVIVKNFILAISPAQLWFLPMLFWIYLVFYFFSDFIERVPIHTILALYVILYIGKLFLNRYVPLNIFQISVSIEYLLYYYMGFLFRRANVAKNSRMKDCAVLISAFILEVIYLLLWIQVKNRFLIDLIQPLVCGFQVAAVLTISRIFRAEKLSVFHTFQKISKNSMGIYLFHQQILYVSMKIFTNFSPLV